MRASRVEQLALGREFFFFVWNDLRSFASRAAKRHDLRPTASFSRAMRVGTFEEHADKLVRDRRHEDMAYEEICRGNAAGLVARLRQAFPQFQSVPLAVRLRNGFVTVENTAARLVHFAYHPILHRPTVWWYKKERRHSIKKEWCFWEEASQQPDPATVLPRDMLTYILTFCGSRDVLHMRRMSRAWRIAASNHSLWERRFLCMDVWDQEPSAQAFIDYFLGFETDEQLCMIGRAWFNSIGESPRIQLYTGERGSVTLLGQMDTKVVSRWVGTGEDGSGVVAWVNFKKLYVKSVKSRTGFHTMPIKRWLLKYMFKYCDDMYEGKI
jgi:hypothetical protein